jgi:hypothetical protein
MVRSLHESEQELLVGGVGKPSGSAYVSIENVSQPPDPVFISGIFGQMFFADDVPGGQGSGNEKNPVEFSPSGA